MAIFSTKDLPKLKKEMLFKSKLVGSIAANVINRSATFAIKESIREITSEVNLKPSYIKSKITSVKRASFKDLEAVVSSNTRNTLLTRYPHTKTSNGYSVSVNRTGGFRNIKGAKMMRLLGSGNLTLGVTNREAVSIFKANLSKGAGVTVPKTNKLFKLAAKARVKPNGMTPLSSRSINQLFTSVRKDIQPQLGVFMRDEFLREFRLKSK